LIGQRDERTTSSSRGPDGRRSTSTTTTKVPILEPAALRTLPFGTAVLLMKSAPPIALTLQPRTDRKDAKALARDREATETAIRSAHAGTLSSGALSATATNSTSAITDLQAPPYNSATTLR
jgi:type IV secretory pathway TraG/TraD family ATPase VirD4